MALRAIRLVDPTSSSKLEIRPGGLFMTFQLVCSGPAVAPSLRLRCGLPCGPCRGSGWASW